jgi:hypothetical protein
MTGIRGDDRNQGGGWSVAVPALLKYIRLGMQTIIEEQVCVDGASINGTLVPYTSRLVGISLLKTDLISQSMIVIQELCSYKC